MKARNVLPSVVLTLCLSTLVCAQRVLERTEVLQIFQELTAQPCKTWIPAGTIEATHREYRAPKTTDSAEITAAIATAIQQYQDDPDKVEQTEELQKMMLDAIPFNVRYRLANESTMNSHVVLRYDGERFYWEISVDSRQDSIQPDAAVTENHMAKYFNTSWNGRRVSAWDGEKYTTYTASGNHATVDTAGRLPCVVNGPLTAGVIPWGSGPFTYDSLSAAQTTATEVYLDGKTQIQMTITRAGGSETSVTLDPARGYAATSCTLPLSNNTIASNRYDGYQQIAGNWVPSAISIDCRDALTNKLVSSEQWTFMMIDGQTPTPDSFIVDYEPDTFVDYVSVITDTPSSYLYSYSVDTNRLLADRLAYAAMEGRQRQNCATAALKHVVAEAGKSASGSALASLVSPDGQTTLYAMKQFALGLGLYCRAVRTDLATLETIGPAEAILHIPGKNHFVALDCIDDRHVRLVDLSNSRFYYRQNVDFFPMEWSDGVALLISRTPIVGRFQDIDDRTLGTLVGGSGYSCTRLLQAMHYYGCLEPCEGYYEYYYERYGCEPAPSGTCTSNFLVRSQESACIPCPIYYCTITGEWYYYYMRACE